MDTPQKLAKLVLDSAVRTECDHVAKGYHVLAGFLRDLRNARGDAADGSQTANELLDGVFDELELLLEGVDGDVPLGDEGGDDACVDADDEAGSDLQSQDAPVPSVVREEGPVGGVATRRVRAASVRNGVSERVTAPAVTRLQQMMLPCPGDKRRGKK